MAKSLPIGTIKQRSNGNFIKTEKGWKYHSSKTAAQEPGTLILTDPPKSTKRPIHSNEEKERFIKLLGEEFVNNHMSSRVVFEGTDSEFITFSVLIGRMYTSCLIVEDEMISIDSGKVTPDFLKLMVENIK